MDIDILDELWAAKDEISKEFKYSVRGLANSLKNHPYPIGEQPESVMVAEEREPPASTGRLQ